ncbi:hypothetical protein [Glaesserella parasuis]|uniref:hypothetical protein n=1 Tax=Glaesserella parasuis TaxID=738 RepID=UPI001329A917|nr:hypothetical protein [Glaesserella parasuis]MDO9950843.1 hypothetical protein [Glaesserella parasuis]MWQ13309.1 hypothetical protein [Glaesserella parasuis]
MRKAKLLWKFIIGMMFMPFAALFVLALEFVVFIFNAVVNFEFRWEKLDGFDGLFNEWKDLFNWFKREWKDA